MEKIIDFATNNYLVFTIIASVLVLALIGYAAENSAGKDVRVKKKKEKKIKPPKESKQAPVVEQPESLE